VNRDEFRLTLPSRSEHLGTARSFAAAVARHYAITGEAVEDLKIAVSEACVDALVAGAPISVLAEEDGSVVAFSVDAPEPGEDHARADLDELGAPARIELIRTLFPDATIASHNGRRTIRFSLSTP
jgi:anti-sigma regulatory factor (Ser/Thr protein kinase)